MEGKELNGHGTEYPGENKPLSDELVDSFKLGFFFLIDDKSKEPKVIKRTDGLGENFTIYPKKRAKTLEDFETLYNQKLVQHGGADTPEWHRRLTYKLKRMIDQFKKEHENGRDFETEDDDLMIIANRFIEYLNSLEKAFAGNSMITEPSEAEKGKEELRTDLNKLGLFDLPKIKELSQIEQMKLINTIYSKSAPYNIAMFDYLGLLGSLFGHLRTWERVHKTLSPILKVSVRAVKGNLLTLNEASKENREKYTAHMHKETVKKDYQNLKNGSTPPL